MTAPSFQLLTFGRLALVDAAGSEDRSLGTRRRKLALLTLLALSRRPLSRDTLVEMFWGDQSEDRARHSLSDALSHLRRALGSDSITTRRAEVGLVDTGALITDAVLFPQLVDSGQVADAIALYNGPFLDGVHVGGSSSWEQWVGQHRARFGALFQDACKRECTRLASTRNWADCARIAERWLTEEPLSPHAALHLLAALAATDSPEDDLRAMAAYDRLVRRLHVEYECTPDSRVTLAAHELAERIRAAKAVNPFVNTTPYTAPTATTPSNVDDSSPTTVSINERHHHARRRRAWFMSGTLVAVALVAVGMWRFGNASAGYGEARTVIAKRRPDSTPSSEARSLYDRAVAELRAGGDRDKAVALLEQAVANDTTFVGAHRRLAQLLNSDETSHARVVDLLSRAVRHASHAPDTERLLVMGDYHMYVTRDYARAASALRNLLDMDRDNSSAWHRLGMVYQYVGDARRASDAYRKSVQLEPAHAAGWSNLIDALYASGDAVSARRTLVDMERAVPGHPAVFWQTAMLSAAEGDYTRAEQQVRAYIAATRTDDHEQAIGQRLLARILWSAGEFDSGDKAQQLAIELDGKRRDHASALRELLVLTTASVWHGRQSRLDVAQLNAALDAHPLNQMRVMDRPYAELAIARALSGDIVGARRALAVGRAGASPARREQDSSAYQVARGTIAIAEGRYRDAIRELEVATTSMCTLCGLPELGIAYEALGHADSAAMVYRRYMQTPTLWRADLLDAYHRRWVLARLSDGGGKDVVTSESLRADRR